MMRRRVMLKCPVLLLMIAAVLVSCSMFQAPMDDVKVLSCSFDPDFAANGIVQVKMIPMDADGNLLEYIDDVTAIAIYDGKAEALDTDLDERVNASTLLPWAIAIDIDSSGSMGSTDPERLRVDAAKLFAQNILNAKSNSEFNVYDFGAGYTPGFTDTRKLTSDWTSDDYDINNAVGKVVASGGTPLFESVLEVLEEVNDEKSSVFWQRALLVLSDGAPSTTSAKEDVYEYAVENKIPVNTVSLGAGSYEETMSELAEKTGGIYTGAEDASSLADAFEAISVGTSDGYLVYTLTFRNPSDLSSGTSTPVSIKLVVSSRSVNKVLDLQLN